MAPLACLLQEQGHRVRGTDGPLYPPMSTLLERAGIQPSVGYDPAHLDPRAGPGGGGQRHPPRQPRGGRGRAPRPRRSLSMPQALARFFLAGRRPLVVAGTHGKTTTTAMAAWVYTACGGDPGYLIGGAPRDLPASFHGGTGERFIIEGDEYNAAYFDRGPKFLHYQPETLMLTSVEYDHADLYPTPGGAAGRLRPADRAAAGRAASWSPAATAPRCASSRRGARCPVVFYGLGPGNDLHPLGPRGAARGQPLPGARRRRPADRSRSRCALAGRHNVANALGVWAAARRDGLPAAEAAAALGRFQRRQAPARGAGDGARRHRGRRFRPPPDGGRDDARRPAPALPRPAAGGAVRAAQPDRRPALVLRALRDRPSPAPTGCSSPPSSTSGRLADDERLDFAELPPRSPAAACRRPPAPPSPRCWRRTLAEARDGGRGGDHVLGLLRRPPPPAGRRAGNPNGHAGHRFLSRSESPAPAGTPYACRSSLRTRTTVDGRARISGSPVMTGAFSRRPVATAKASA